MRRREFITVVAGAAAMWPPVARAQQASSILRVGSVSLQPSSAPFNIAFQQRMAELRYQEGKNFAFDFVKVASWGAYETAYGELVTRNVDILLAGGPEIALKSAIAASQAIPIVMIAIDYDPFARGYVTSLAQPGGRITGLFLRQIELTEKRLQFFKDAFPDMEAAMAFWDRISVDQWEAAQSAAARLGIRLAGVDLGAPPFDYEHALAQAPPECRKHLFVLNSPLFFADRMR